MALTPEQVLNKHFQTTQFRRGYEERDVDDFLDEIVAEMRSLIEQRDDYLKQLNDCRASRNQPAVRGGDAGEQSSPRSDDEGKLASVAARIEDAERAFKAASDRAAKASADAEEAENQARERIEAARGQADQVDASDASDRAQESTASAEATSSLDDAQPAAVDPATGEGADASGLITLAQRLHDEHIAAGEARRDELIAEAEATHARLIAEAQDRHAELLATGQAKFDELTGAGQAQHDASVREAQELTARANAERDEMIAASTAERDRMIAEATRARDEMLTAARERSTAMVAEAQQKRAGVLEQLDKDKSRLGRTIDELRGFERTYRGNLRTYLQGQLHDLDGHPQEPGAVDPAASTDHAHPAPDSI